MLALQNRSPLLACSVFMRHFSTSEVIDEMITYARANSRDNYDQAMDILKSGLGYQQTGVEAGRLYLVQAEIHADRSHWPEVSQLCRQAAAAASETHPNSASESLSIAEVELAASLMGTRAFLTQHKDAEALQMAQQCLEVARKSFTATGTEDQRWQGLVLSHAIAALTQHAACDMDTANESFDEVMSIADHVDQRTGPVRPRDHFIAQALKQVAVFRLAQRNPEEALVLGTRALTASKKSLEYSLGKEGSKDPMLCPTLCTEAVADCHLVQGQACIDKKDWEGAESFLGEALSTIEGLSSSSSGATHMRIAHTLIPLAWVYSRTGKVTLAEGLYREISKIMKLSPLSAATPAAAENVDILEVHPSVAALAAWRYAQLLTALSRRDTEAAGWHRLAKQLYDDVPLKRVLEPARVFGSLDHLQGKGSGGSGVVLDLMTRRALPRVASPLGESEDGDHRPI